MAYWNHRKNLLYWSYFDYWRLVAMKLGISESEVLKKLDPFYKEKDQNGQQIGRKRADRYAIWADHQLVLDESHDDRLRILEKYMRLIYPKLVKEVRKEEEVQAYFKRPVTIPTVTKTKKRVSGLEQLEFDFRGAE